MANDLPGARQSPSWWQRPPRRRILFVCTANICRSPLAHALLREKLRSLGLGAAVKVGSAGCEVVSPGRRPDARIARLAREKGVSLHGIRSHPLRAKSVAASDEILVMEKKHIDRIACLYPGPGPVPSVRLLGSLLDHLPSEWGDEIPDPYYGDADTLVRIWALLDEAVEILARQLAEDLSVDAT